MKKIPHDAFDHYFALGPGRSYQAVAEKFAVTKRAVTDRARREGWQRRVAEVEAKARERSDERKVEALEAAKENRIQALRLVLAKGIEGLKPMHITGPGDAVRAIATAVRELRVELGEPSERTAVSIEDTIRREYERWMTAAGSEDNGVEPPEGSGQGDDGG
jgi:hypothetical protein